MSVSTRSSVDGHRIILFYSHKLPVGYTMSMYTPYTIFIYLYGAPFSTKKISLFDQKSAQNLGCIL